MKLDLPWTQSTFVAFDLETSGKYPLESQICEIGAVKWHNGVEVAQFQTLIRPDHKVPDEIIAIHGITNEELATAPKISEKINEFYNFTENSILIAHHAPFDMGFLAIEFENYGLKFPKNNVLCSSLLSRKSMPEMENHRLQTLVKSLKLDGGKAHRALDDARSSLLVALKCFERIGPHVNVQEILKYQEFNLEWSDYSMAYLRGHKVFGEIIKAIEQKEDLQITYQGGSNPGKARTIRPLGLVRNARDDYLVADPIEGGHSKRYYLRKITKATM
ncbi:MAG: 3'-5' exoribonuclease [Bdellovibrionales bacterium]|nr:3'-5' exoribonuclease [Bdellovibrionales bacterium]